MNMPKCNFVLFSIALVVVSILLTRQSTIASAPGDEVTTKALHIVDSKGRVRIAITMNGEEPCISLLNPEGRNLIQITSSKDSGYLSIANGASDARVVLESSKDNGAMLLIYDSNKERRVNLGGDVDRQQLAIKKRSTGAVISLVVGTADELPYVRTAVSRQGEELRYAELSVPVDRVPKNK